MSDYDHTAQPGDPLPGPDPRMSKEYTSGILNPNKDPRVMHTNPQSQVIDHEETGTTEPTLTNLIDRLDGQLRFITSLRDNLREANDKLGGAQPIADDEKATPKVESCLQYAHELLTTTQGRLVDLDGEIKRLNRNIGS